MPVTLDLNFLPLVRQNGQDQPEWAGLYVATPPRGAARGRDIDLLALYLSTGGTAPLPADQLGQLMPRLAQVYYRSAGTATAALKAVVDELNRILLERNLRASNTGRQGVGLLTQAVLRGDMLYLAHSGTVQTYLIKPEATSLLMDDVGGARGLGVSRTVNVRYFHTGLQPGDYLVFSHRPPAGWNINSIRLQPGQGMESLRRRLLAHAGPEMQAVLVQALAGDGKLRLLRLKAPPTTLNQPVGESQPEIPPATPPAVPEIGSASQSMAELPQPAAKPPTDEMVPPNDWVSMPAAATISESTAAPEIAVRKPMVEREQAKPKADLRQVLQPVLQGVGAVSQAIGRALGKFFRALGSFAGRILPDETLLNFSPTSMIFLAVLLPVMISILGGMMYIQRGQALQHEEYLNKAHIAADRASASETPDEQRSNWRLVLDMLDEAEFYKTSETSIVLRKQALHTLDELDGVERLDFQPVLRSGLGETIQVARLAAQPGELYLLDGPSGMVLRAQWTGGAFELDRSFTCGPVSGENSAGPLIDLVIPPRSNPYNAVVAGMDANGNLVFCAPGNDPTVERLDPPPMNFRTPKSFTFSGNDLYVLDPGNNGVWIYWDMAFKKTPRLFFGDQVPFMQDVVDLVVNNDDLYLLHSNGSQTVCYYSSMDVAPTRCEDPVNYIDSRPGRENGPVIPDSLFDQVYFAPPPDPSLYLLDPANQAVFHFSLRLNFQQQYRSANEMPDAPASAFAVSSDRLVFIAVKNEVFFAALP